MVAPPPIHWRIAALALAAGTLAAAHAATALAQPAQRRALRPVDQAVEDVDPHAASRRHIDTGNAVISPRSRMFRIDPGQARTWTPGIPALTAERFPYFYQGRGMQAIAPRADYLVLEEAALFRPEVRLNRQPRRDGEFIELMPAGAVFNLIPDAGRPRGETPAQQAAPRLTTRFGEPVRARIGGEPLGSIPADEAVFPPRPLPPPPGPDAPDDSNAAQVREATASMRPRREYVNFGAEPLRPSEAPRPAE